MSRRRRRDDEYPPIMRVSMACEYLGVSRDVLARWRQQGRIVEYRPDPERQTVWLRRDELDAIDLTSPAGSPPPPGGDGRAPRDLHPVSSAAETDHCPPHGIERPS